MHIRSPVYVHSILISFLLIFSLYNATLQDVFHRPVSWGNGRLSKKDHSSFIFLQASSFRDLARTCLAMARRSLRLRRRRSSRLDRIWFTTVHGGRVEERRSSLRTRPVRMPFGGAPRKKERTQSLQKNPTICKNWNYVLTFYLVPFDSWFAHSFAIITLHVGIIMPRNERSVNILWTGTCSYRSNTLG